MPLCSLEEALEDLTAGKFVIVVDDEGRETRATCSFLQSTLPPPQSRLW